jgi:GNAT superfamily N-acetyltransferase
VLERLVFHEVDARRWRDLEQLFESPGGPKNCWCMVWRPLPRKSSRGDAGLKKAALKQRVEAGTPVGILGYLDGEPAAWCSIAPRLTYRNLGGLTDPSEPPDSVWSLVCFFVPAHLRKKRVTGRLISAAVDHARSRGATAIEAYPVDPDSPSYRFMGFVSSFEAAGFVEFGRAGSRRHVMRLSLVS